MAFPARTALAKASAEESLPRLGAIKQTRLLPPGGGLPGLAFGPAGDPMTHGPGKSIATQHLGTVIGRRGAGISQFGGDQGAHAMNNYGKAGLPGLNTPPAGGSLF